MQKRKTPIFLIVAAATIFVATLLITRVDFATLFAPPEPAQPAQATEDQQSQGPSREQLRAMVQGEERANVTSAGGSEVVWPNRPALMTPTQERVMPTPNDSSTSGQWFREQSREQKRTEEVRKIQSQ
ncbi:MAG: hypothetical protein MUC92_03350 [Fimbriimonadaceae bacterium]|jgi:hypothetical protein|nr:hypothetical protein [Fimbriimonadaceae bacterium]